MMGAWWRMAVVGGLLLAGSAAFAAENWPDSLDQRIAEIRKTIKTTDMEGYLTAVQKPEGALLLDVRRKANSRPATCPAPRIFRADCSSFGFGGCSAIPAAST